MKKLMLLILLTALSWSAHAIKQDELLPPDEAFQFSATMLDNDSVRLRWDIAEGYYLYRERFNFTSQTNGLTLNPAAAKYPAGDIKDDPNFGEMEVYYNQVSLNIPFNRTGNPQARQLIIQAKYQGCADIGLCYPPKRKTATLKLMPVAAKGSAQAVTNSIIPSLSGTSTPLTAEQAFRFSLIALDKNTLKASWQITPEHYLYRDKVNFKIMTPDTATLGEAEFPTGKIVNDEFFGEMEVYEQTLDVLIPVKDTANIEELTVETEYQGCSEATGICYPSVKKQNVLSLTAFPETAGTPNNSSSTEGDSLTKKFFSGSFLGTLLAFFVIGLGLSLTPCIFPMLPILSGIIAGQDNLSAYKAFTLSLTYVIASATAYALIGLVFGFFGENLQSSLQHPVAISFFAVIFVVLALSMFGFFDLQMPTSIQSRLNEISNKQRGGSLIGAAIMGFLSTLIVGPCVAPALAAALTYIANSKDALLGASALFSMGFGMGVILLVAGTLGGHLLPRAGAWMDTTKAIFGIMLLGLAIWMLSRIVPIGVTMLLTGILLVSSGIYMGALDKLSEAAGGWERFWKSIGLTLLFFGTTHLLGVATGSQNILQPLKGIFSINVSGQTNLTEQHQGLNFQRIKSVDELNRILKQAKQSQQPAMLDFYADWCVDCIRMEKEAFASPAIKSALGNTIVLQADVTKRDTKDRELEKHFGIVGPPTIIFFDRNGNEIRNLRMIGYEDTTAFAQRIEKFQQQLR